MTIVGDILKSAGVREAIAKQAEEEEKKKTQQAAITGGVKTGTSANLSSLPAPVKQQINKTVTQFSQGKSFSKEDQAFASDIIQQTASPVIRTTKPKKKSAVDRARDTASSKFSITPKSLEKQKQLGQAAFSPLIKTLSSFIPDKPQSKPEFSTFETVLSAPSIPPPTSKTKLQNLISDSIDLTTGLIKSANAREESVRNKLSFGKTALAAFHLPYPKLKEMFPEEVAIGEKLYFEEKATQEEIERVEGIRDITGFKFIPKFLINNLSPEFIQDAQAAFIEQQKGKLPQGVAMEQLALQERAIEEQELEGLDPVDRFIRKTGKVTHKFIDPFAEGVVDSVLLNTVDVSKSKFQKEFNPETFATETLRFTGALAGAFIPYGLISKTIKGAVSVAAASNVLSKASTTYKALNTLDKLAKSNKLWQSVLVEASVFNLLEETTDAALRKGLLKQDYTFDDFIIGLTMGAGLGSTLQIGGAKLKITRGVIKTKQMRDQLQAAADVFERTKNIQDVKEMPLGKSTFNDVFKETQFAYLKGKKDATVRQGIEESTPPPTPKEVLDTTVDNITRPPQVPKNKIITPATDPKKPGGSSEAVLGSSEPSKLGIEEAVSFVTRKKPPITERLDNIARTMYTAIKDEYHSLEVIFGRDSDVMRRIRVEGGAIGRAEESVLRTGTFDYKTLKNNGESFQKIVGGMDDVKRVDFSNYIVAVRDLSARKNTPNYKSNIDEKSAKDFIERMDITYNKEFVGMTKRVISFNKKTLQYVKDSGYISQKQFDDITKANPDYTAPFFREVDDGNKFLSGVKGDNGLKRLKGTTDVELKIKDPLANIVKNTYALMDAVNKNEIKQLMIKAVENNPLLEKFFKKSSQIKSRDVYRDGKIESEFYSVRPAGAMEVVIDGKKQYFDVDKDVLKAMSGFDKSQSKVMNKFLDSALTIAGGPARLLRAGATLTPEFLLKNVFRDQLSAAIYSKHGYAPFIDLVRGMYALTGKSASAKELRRLHRISGAEYASITSVDEVGIQKTLKEIVSGKGKAYYVKHPMELLRVANEFGEQGTRMREFQKSINKSLKEGVNVREALNKAAFEFKDLTLQFSRMGTLGRQVNRVSAFFNAALEDMDKMVREHKTRPVQTTLKSLAYITVPTVMMYFVNKDNDDYKNLPQWRKDLYWNIPTGNPSFPFVAIPRPFGLGIIYGAMPERILQRIEGEDPEAFKGFGETLKDGFIPNVTPTAMTPLIENTYNESMFTGGSIVPRRKENLEPELQFGRYTSESAKFLGDIFNISPAKIENVYRGYTAGLGQYALQASDAALALFTDLPPKPTRGITQFPGLKGILIAKPIGSKAASVGEFYDLAGEAETALDSYKFIREHSPEKADAYLKEHAQEIAISKILDKKVIEISSLNKEKDAVLEHMTMTSDEKKKEIDRIDTAISDFTLASLKELNSKKYSHKEAEFRALNTDQFDKKAKVWLSMPSKEKKALFNDLSDRDQDQLEGWVYATEKPSATRRDLGVFLNSVDKSSSVNKSGLAGATQWRSHKKKVFVSKGVDPDRIVNEAGSNLKDMAAVLKAEGGSNADKEAKLNQLVKLKKISPLEAGYMFAIVEKF